MSLEQPPDLAGGAYRLSSSSSLALDLIRTVAAQAVLVGHSLSLLGLLPWVQPPHFAYIQNIAVVLFFLLSGLLISYSVLSRSRRPAFGDYLIDRFARIYSGLVPALFFIAACDAAVIWLLGARYENPGDFTAIDFFGNVLMLQDYPLLSGLAGITSFGSGRVLWTLAVEWWLYLAFGWLILVQPSGWRYWMGLLILAPVPFYNLVAGRGDGLTAMWIVGVLGCLALRSGALERIDRRAKWLWLAVLILAAVARLMVTKDAYDLLFAGLTGGALVLLIEQLDGTEWKAPAAFQRTVKFAADYSFTLYLVHLSVIHLLMNLTKGWPPVASFWALFVASNLVAAVLALKTEMQHYRLRRFLKQRFALSPSP